MLREAVREGLDADQPFAETFAPETDSLQRLEAVAETLVQFLKSLEDGIITETLWLEMENGILERDKDKKKAISNEDERMQILETLSTAPAHNASFTLVTLMLARVANEVAPPDLPPTVQKEAQSTTEHAAPQNRRTEIDAAYADTFAGAMIRLPASLKGKERKASETRRKHVVEMFVRPRG